MYQQIRTNDTLSRHLQYIVSVFFYAHNEDMREYNKLFRKLIKDESLKDVPLNYIIKVFAVLRTLLESEEYNV